MKKTLQIGVEFESWFDKDREPKTNDDWVGFFAEHFISASSVIGDDEGVYQDMISIKGCNIEIIEPMIAEFEKPLPTEQFAEIIERLWKDYRLVTNNEDSWCFKNWLVERVRIESTLMTEKCDVCGCHPSILIRTSFGTFCQEHAKY